MSALNITNGDAVAGLIRASGVAGEVLPWRDMLHDGPVPPGLSLEELSRVRARFIADGPGGQPYEEVLRSFGERDRELKRFRRHEHVVLWFEHDLYDQLQLLQILSWFGLRAPVEPRLSMICIGKFPGIEPFHGLGQLSMEQIGGLYETRSPVTAEQIELARRGWQALTADTPLNLQALVGESLAAMPFLRDALTRLLEQYPSTRDGLSRSERQALRAVDSDGSELGTVFRLSQIEREEAPFMGDRAFLRDVEALCGGEQPLLEFEDGRGVDETSGPSCGPQFWRRRVRITEPGQKVAGGRLDRSRFQPIDRWIGGVHLTGAEPAWRWSHGTREVVPQSQ